MENQHRKISGYRELSQVEIDLMNDIKKQGIALKEIIDRVNDYLSTQRDAVDHMPQEQQVEEEFRLNDAEPEIWVFHAKKELQSGLMSLTRSVAQPTFF